MARSWDQLVAAGKKAVEKESDAKWELGDLALEVAPMGDDAAHNGALETMDEYAEAVGVEFETLRQYRSVAHEWPRGTRVPGASWSAHREAMGNEKMRRILTGKQKPPKGKATWTVDALRQKAGKQPTRHEPPPRSYREKAEVAAEYLREPEVRSEMAAIPKAADAVSRAAGEVASERHERATGAQRKRAPKLVGASDYYNGLGRLTSARRAVEKALAEFRKVDLNDEQRESINEDVEEIEARLDWLRSYVKSGDRSFDAELDRLLAASE
jgi:hypothetical protein